MSRKLRRFLFTFLTGFTSFIFFFFLLCQSFVLCMVFDVISSDIDEVISVNTSANLFVSRDVNDWHHKDWLIDFGGTDRPGELCYNLK